MLNIQKSSLILILIIVVLIAGFVSLVTLGYTPGSVWHKAEDVKAGTFGNNVGQGNYNFPGNVGIKTPSPSSTLDVTGNIYANGQVTAGTKFAVGGSSLTGTSLTVASGGTSTIGGGLVVGTPTDGDKGKGTINAEKIYINGVEIGTGMGGVSVTYSMSVTTIIESERIKRTSKSFTCPNNATPTGIVISGGKWCSHSESGSTITVTATPNLMWGTTSGCSCTITQQSPVSDCAITTCGCPFCTSSECSVQFTCGAIVIVP